MAALDFEKIQGSFGLGKFLIVKLRKFHERSELVKFTIEFGLKQIECSDLENFS